MKKIKMPEQIFLSTQSTHQSFFDDNPQGESQKQTIKT